MTNFYFNGSVTDADSVWSDDSNCADGSTSTASTTTTTSANFTSNIIQISGTNAPSSGLTITSVKCRVYASASGSLDSVITKIFTGDDEDISDEIVNSSDGAWTGYTTLSTPTGGWSWSEVQNLVAKVRYSGGAEAGTASLFKIEILVNPVEIDSWEDLANISQDLSADYVLTADLSSETTGYDTYASSSANRGAGWLPIGDNTNRFTGSFDGDGHTISDLYIDRDATAYVGLFSSTENSVIENVGLINVSVLGRNYTGGLSGRQGQSSLINNCWTTGSVSGGDSVGGIAGILTIGGSITNSYSTGSVFGLSRVGGLVGYSSNSPITNCYSTGSVTRKSGTEGDIAGFVGRNYRSSITKCYSTGSVHYTGYDDPTDKGFVGSEDTGEGYADVGNFFDSQTSGQSTTTGNATAKTTSQMKDIDTFTGASWDIVLKANYDDEEWFIDDGNDYPRLGWEWESDTGFNKNSNARILISDSFTKTSNATIQVGDLNQHSFRFRDDDDSETSATWLQSENTNLTRGKELNTRIRFLIDSVGDQPTKNFQLEVRKKGDEEWLKI